MGLLAFAADGYEGYLVAVEVDIRRGIPGLDVVGLPDGAVREARERVRAAIRNSGFEFPQGRILINLAPAGRRKEGASFDLAMAAGILQKQGSLPWSDRRELLVMGELNLSGEIRGVPGVLSAVASGLARGVRDFVVPRANLEEAAALKEARVFGVRKLKDLIPLSHRVFDPGDPGDGLRDPRGAGNAGEPSGCADCAGIPGGPGELPGGLSGERQLVDFREIRGQGELKRALEIAAAGGHHILLFGPPGSGKTMAARAVPGILPVLDSRDSLEVTRIHSMAGLLADHAGLIRRPPFRSPHHSASAEGLIGGGRFLMPGEVSLAHKGTLFLDEVPEFRKDLLQNLREPLECGRVHLVRADRNCWYPAEFQLILAANPCPCGNLGKEKGICVCSPQEVRRYWRRLGGALIDRIDMRLPVRPVPAEDFRDGSGEPSSVILDRVAAAAERQADRYRKEGFSKNARIPSGRLHSLCPLDEPQRGILEKAIKQLSLSSRAVDSLLRLSRTIADLEGSEVIGKYHLLEAIQYRRFGDGDYFWRAG